MPPPQRSGFKDGWSKTGKLRTGLPQEQGLTMQAQFTQDIGGSGAQYYTVQFSVKPPKTGFFEAVADVIWSVEGVDVRRKISIVNGATISGTAQAVKVSVVDTTDRNVLPHEEYEVDIAVTPGVRPAQQQPPRLFGGVFSIPAEGPSINVPIPQDAGVISVNISAYRVPFTTPLALGDAMGLMGNAIPLSGFVVKPEGDGWIPVPPGANNLELVNNSAFALGYGVTWGIEG
jgi:hypothetical protein